MTIKLRFEEFCKEGWSQLFEQGSMLENMAIYRVALTLTYGGEHGIYPAFLPFSAVFLLGKLVQMFFYLNLIPFTGLTLVRHACLIARELCQQKSRISYPEMNCQ